MCVERAARGVAGVGDRRLQRRCTRSQKKGGASLRRLLNLLFAATEL